MKLSLGSLVTLSLVMSSGISAAAIKQRDGIEERAVIEQRQQSSGCPPAPTGSTDYRIDNLTVDRKGSGSASGISFDIARSTTGAKAITCKPEIGFVSGIVSGFKEGKEYECDGFGNGKYKFAYWGPSKNALWLQYDGLTYVVLGFSRNLDNANTDTGVARYKALYH
jgi:hypothetical protein